MNKIRIIERSSGFWAVNDDGPIEGPFDTLEDAQEWMDNHCGYCGSGLINEKGECQKCGL